MKTSDKVLLAALVIITLGLAYFGNFPQLQYMTSLGFTLLTAGYILGSLGIVTLWELLERKGV